MIIKEMENKFQEGEELKYHITRSLINLCKLSNALPQNLKGNLKIKTHETSLSENVMIVDNDLVKVEEYGSLVGPHYRHSKLTFRKDNVSFFDRYYDYLHSVTSLDYTCKDMWKGLFHGINKFNWFKRFNLFLQFI